MRDVAIAYALILHAASAQATVQGYVYQDNNANNVYTPGIDQGFQGAMVNLYRSVGGVLTFLGCTSSDGTGTSSSI